MAAIYGLYIINKSGGLIFYKVTLLCIILISTICFLRTDEKDSDCVFFCGSSGTSINKNNRLFLHFVPYFLPANSNKKGDSVVITKSYFASIFFFGSRRRLSHFCFSNLSLLFANTPLLVILLQ